MNRYEDRNYLRVTKAAARKLYEAGETVILCPCNLRPGWPWYPEVEVKKETQDADFETILNHFEFYNLNPETGRYVNYFVRK